MSKTKSIPHLIDDRPTWDLIQKRNEEFLKELEAKYGPRPAPGQPDDLLPSRPQKAVRQHFRAAIPARNPTGNAPQQSEDESDWRGYDEKLAPRVSRRDGDFACPRRANFNDDSRQRRADSYHGDFSRLDAN